LLNFSHPETLEEKFAGEFPALAGMEKCERLFHEVQVLAPA